MRRVAPVLWAVVVLLTAVPPIASGYSAAWALPVLAGCVLAPFGVAALGRLARVPRWVVATAGLAIGVVVALVFADRIDEQSGALPTWRSSPALSAIGPLIDAVPRLLTAPRPAPADPSLLVPAALLVWIVALAVAAAVVGTRRAGIAPLVGAVVLHLAGGLLTAGRGDVLGTSALATALALLLGWVLIPSGTRPTSPGTAGSRAAEPAAAQRRTVGAAGRHQRGVVLPAIVAVVVATFALTAVAVPTSRSFEPRTLVPPPQLPVDGTNPVPQAALWAQSPTQPMLTVTAVDGPLPDRLAIAVLPDFTGVAWTLDAELRPLGVVAEADTAPGRFSRTASYTLSADGYAEAWIPAAGTASEVLGADTLLDLDSGTLVAPSGWAGTELTVTSLVNDPSPEAIGQASVPQSADVQRYLELPRAPQVITTMAQLATDGATSRWDQISALADAIRHDRFRVGATGEERVLDHGARSGSSYGRLTTFLTASPEEGGQIGTSEQFAASFAVLARSLGIPTRLVVGFDVPEGTGSVEVLGEHARVWAEVYLARVGWVAVDPSPDSSTSTELPTPEAEGGGQDDPTAEPTDGASGDETVIDPETEGDRSTPSAALLALGLAVVGVLGLLGLALARAWRRRRWHAAGDRGAWAQLEDAMRLAGVPSPPGSTALQLATSLPTGSAAAVVVAERAEAAAFAPSDHRASDPAAAGPDASSWSLSRRVETRLRRGASWWRRLLWWVSPRVWGRGRQRR